MEKTTYLIVGVHPEHADWDRVWVAREVETTDLAEAYAVLDFMPEIDGGVGHYELWTKEPLLPVDLPDGDYVDPFAFLNDQADETDEDHHY